MCWLALHRVSATRTGARTALWETDVRDATFANVVSDARRNLARTVAPAESEEWIGRTLTESLPLHPPRRDRRRPAPGPGGRRSPAAGGGGDRAAAPRTGAGHRPPLRRYRLLVARSRGPGHRPGAAGDDGRRRDGRALPRAGRRRRGVLGHRAGPAGPARPRGARRPAHAGPRLPGRSGRRARRVGIVRAGTRRRCLERRRTGSRSWSNSVASSSARPQAVPPSDLDGANRRARTGRFASCGCTSVWVRWRDVLCTRPDGSVDVGAHRSLVGRPAGTTRDHRVGAVRRTGRGWLLR